MSVEERLGTTFVGLDAGWNVMNDAVHLRPPAARRSSPPAPSRRATARRRSPATSTRATTSSPPAIPFPEVGEGEIVAFVSIGGYCPGMWTDHCLRPRAATLYFTDRV